MRFSLPLFGLLLGLLASPALFAQQAMHGTTIVFDSSPQMWTCAYVDPEFLRAVVTRPIVNIHEGNPGGQVLSNAGHLGSVNAMADSAADEVPPMTALQDSTLYSGGGGPSVGLASRNHVWGWLRTEQKVTS